jgi:hypothetical protein
LQVCQFQVAMSPTVSVCLPVLKAWQRELQMFPKSFHSVVVRSPQVLWEPD